MTQVDIIFGIVMVSFIFVYIAFKSIENKHDLLGLIFLALSLYLMFLVPKTYTQFNETCNPVINQSSSIGSTTTYSYAQFCTTKTTTSDISFLKIVGYAIWVFWIYVVLYFFFINFFYDLWDKYNKRFGR